jgi:hypothetical protein
MLSLRDASSLVPHVLIQRLSPVDDQGGAGDNSDCPMVDDLFGAIQWIFPLAHPRLFCCTTGLSFNCDRGRSLSLGTLSPSFPNPINERFGRTLTPFFSLSQT